MVLKCNIEYIPKVSRSGSRLAFGFLESQLVSMFLNSISLKYNLFKIAGFVIFNHKSKKVSVVKVEVNANLRMSAIVLLKERAPFKKLTQKRGTNKNKTYCFQLVSTSWA